VARRGRTHGDPSARRAHPSRAPESPTIDKSRRQGGSAESGARMGGTTSSAGGYPGPVLPGKALLVACKTSNCYVSGSEWAGSGCEAHLAAALLPKLGFLKHKIMMVANNPKTGKKVLTKNMLMSGLAWLVDGVKSGDHLVFYFSNSSNFTQADLRSAVKEVLVDGIPPGATLHVVGDGAHSRDIVQLPHTWHWTNARKGKAWKGLQNISSKMLNGIHKCRSSEVNIYLMHWTTESGFMQNAAALYGPMGRNRPTRRVPSCS